MHPGQGLFSIIPSFKSVNTGIFIGGAGIHVSDQPKATSVSIRNNNMDEVKTGIFVKGNGATPSLNIESNAIYCDNVGIDMLNIGHYQKTTVTGNRVYVDYQLGSPISAQKGIGIKVSGSDGQSPLNGSIESNAIHIYERNYGMSLSSLYSGLIRENVIYEYTPDAIAGIQFQGSSLAAIACNYIHGYSSDYFQGKNIGIDVNNSLGNLYLCNQVDHTGIGLRFSGVCSALTSPMIAQTDVRGNSMDEHGYGFMMQSDAIFGSLTKPNIQAHRGNNWSNDYGEDRAIHYGSPDQIALSKFRVHTNGTPYYYYPHSDDTNNPNAPMPPTPYALGHIWFEVIDDGNPYVCGETCLPDHLIETDPDSISTFGLAIAQDSLSFTSEFDAAMKERLRRQLYRLLNEHQALMNQDSSLLQFYSDASSSVISDMTIIDQLKTAAIAVDSTSKAQLLLWDAEIIERFDSISAAESELPSEPDSSEIAEFEAMQIAYLVEIDSFLLLQRELACGIWTSQVAFIDSAFVLNSDTEPSTDMEAN